MTTCRRTASSSRAVMPELTGRDRRLASPPPPTLTTACQAKVPPWVFRLLVVLRPTAGKPPPNTHLAVLAWPCLALSSPPAPLLVLLLLPPCGRQFPEIGAEVTESGFRAWLVSLFLFFLFLFFSVLWGSVLRSGKDTLCVVRRPTNFCNLNGEIKIV